MTSLRQAKIVCEAVKRINPNINVRSYLYRVGEDDRNYLTASNENGNRKSGINPFNQRFYEGIDVIVSALDNVEVGNMPTTIKS